MHQYCASVCRTYCVFGWFCVYVSLEAGLQHGDTKCILYVYIQIIWYNMPRQVGHVRPRETIWNNDLKFVSAGWCTNFTAINTSSRPAPLKSKVAVGAMLQECLGPSKSNAKERLMNRRTHKVWRVELNESTRASTSTNCPATLCNPRNIRVYTLHNMPEKRLRLRRLKESFHVKQDLPWITI